MIHVLTADGSVARLYEVPRARGNLREIVDFGNAVAHLHERDLVTARPGRMVNSASGGRQSFSPATSEKKRATHRWLVGIARALQPLLKSRDSEGLIVVASPRLLAEFREQLPRAVRSQILAEVTRNLSGLPVAELTQRLKAPVQLAEQRVLRTRAS